MDALDHVISTQAYVMNAAQDFGENRVYCTVASDAWLVISQLDALSVIWASMDQHVNMLVLCVCMAAISLQGYVFHVIGVVVTG